MNAPATIRVFTFKEGLLSRLAHDLQLTLRRFELSLQGGKVHGRFELGSLHVDGAVEGGHVVASTLGDSDRRKIERSMADDVLHFERHPVATLEGELQPRGDGRFGLTGTLELAGMRAPVAGELRAGDRITGAFELRPTEWGIKPFKALGGALKIQDRVRVEVDLPPGGGDTPDADCTWRSA
ncbi:MAG: YceI family protein [Myxococcales bacterium]